MSKKTHALQVDNPFKRDVEATPEISGCYRQGLAALGNNSQKITLGNSRDCSGSAFIDGCTENARPNDKRWDYVFSYKNEAVFIEVHPAETGEVNAVLAKLAWLKSWLRDHAPLLEAQRSKAHPYYWIASKSVHLLKGSPQYRRAAQERLLPVSRLYLK